MKHCDLFIDERVEEPRTWDVQIQAGGLVVDLRASDLGFMKRMLDFIAETKGNPAYRDSCIGEGVYTRIADKACDLSSYFTTDVSVQKDGEYDDSYVIRIGTRAHVGVMVDVRGDSLDALVMALEDAMESFV